MANIFYNNQFLQNFTIKLNIKLLKTFSLKTLRRENNGVLTLETVLRDKSTFDLKNIFFNILDSKLLH